MCCHWKIYDDEVIKYERIAKIKCFGLRKIFLGEKRRIDFQTSIEMFFCFIAEAISAAGIVETGSGT